MVKRYKYLNLIQKYLPHTDKILFLLGPRQVGKTTLLKSLFEFNIIDKKHSLFLFWDELAWYGVNSFDSLIATVKSEIDLQNLKYLIIDEAQYIPNIWLILKILIDKVRFWEFNFKIIVSGSGSLNIFTGITDSLIWRKDIVFVWPFSFEEFLLAKWKKFIFTTQEAVIRKYFTYWQEYILFGGYPAVVLASTKEEKFEIFRSIFQDYIFKDIVLLLKQNEFVNFKKFLKIVASKVGSQINISQLTEEAGLKRYIVEKYLFVIENTFLLRNISPWQWWKIKWELKKREKIYFVDIWMLRYILGYPDWIGDFKGKIVENFVLNEIFYSKANYHQVYFWGTVNGGEVDFVIQDEVLFKIYPVEVKSKNKLNIPRSLSIFMDTYNDKIEKTFITTETKFLAKNSVIFLPYIMMQFWNKIIAE